MLADSMPIWKCLLVTIASNLKSIALGSLISSDAISGLDQIQGQSALYAVTQPGTRPLCIGLIQFPIHLFVTSGIIWIHSYGKDFLKVFFLSGEVVLIAEWSKEAVSRCHHLICCQLMRHLVAAEGPAGSLSVRTSREAALARRYLEYK